MSSVYQGFVKGRLATISTEELVRKQNQGPTVHGRLSIERIAFLRAVASGIAKSQAIERYFPDRPAHEQREEAEATIAVARALARRHGDSSAHLIGTDVWAMTKMKSPAIRGLERRYDRDEFIAYLKTVKPDTATHLEDYGDEEVRFQYLEMFTPSEALNPHDDANETRKENRNTRLVGLYVDAVKRLEKITIDTPHATHAIEDWLPARWVAFLTKVGIVTLDDLGHKVRLGGRWFSDLEGLKPGVAAKIERYLDRLLPGQYTVAQAVTMEEVIAITQAQPIAPAREVVEYAVEVVSPHFEHLTPLPRQNVEQRSPACLISSENDEGAIEEWIISTTRSEPTIRNYRKEGHRFIAWLAVERGGKRLHQTSVADCNAYLDFLQNIPLSYITRRRLTSSEAGGLIFRGQLSDASVAQTRTIVSSMFAWLGKVGYLKANPWVLVTKKISRSRTSMARKSKAYDEEWLSSVLDYLAKLPQSAGKSRIVFVIDFVTATGLRPTELVSALMGGIEQTKDGLFLQILGKGEKSRWCVINNTAEGALRQYLRERGLPPLEACDREIPLVSSTIDPLLPVGYQALHESFTWWMKKIDKAINEKSLRGSPTLHRLRHTFATQAVKEEVPYDVIQAQLGHASVNTTISIYATAPDKRRAAELNRLRPSAPILDRSKT